MNCEECRHYPEAGEPCPVNICPNEGEAWPLPELVVSTGAIYAAKPTTGDGAIWPDIRIALMDREEASTVPSERDSYAHQIVTRCNAHAGLVDAVTRALEYSASIDKNGTDRDGRNVVIALQTALSATT